MHCAAPVIEETGDKDAAKSADLVVTGFGLLLQRVGSWSTLLM